MAKGAVRAGLLLTAAVSLTVPSVLTGQDPVIKQEYVQLQVKGNGALDSGPTTPPPTTFDRKVEFPKQDLDALTALIPRAAAKLAKPLTFPTVKNSDIAKSNPGFSGFDGLNHSDQRFAGTGVYTNTQFSSEPPDQGMCVGNGYVLETVNTALAVFRKHDGKLLSGPTALNQFFGLAPEVIRSTPPVFGQFTSDPRCSYDAQVRRFFVTLLEIDTDPATGGFAAGSHLLIAVSQTPDPTRGWNLFELDITNDGAGCPCFGDQPLLGTDANGLYVTTNAFSLVGEGFGGAQIYAMSKLFLAAGAPPPFVLHAGLYPNFNADGSLDFSVHPASRPPGHFLEQFGTEYFLSSFDVTSEVENHVVVWTLRNTVLLNVPPNKFTRFKFMKRVIPSEVYGVPPDAFQKKGLIPLGSASDPGIFEMLATNEHRMPQVTFVGDHLWSAVTTGLLSPGETDVKPGVAWFSVGVEASDSWLQAKVDQQGYVAMANGSAFFPAVGVNGDGDVAIGFSLSSTKTFPSTGYVQIGANGKSGKIHLAGMGVDSEDGYSGYPSLVAAPPPCFPPVPGQDQICEARWGDYGAAAVDEDGAIWLANEYIGPRPRSAFANWGTFLLRLQPGSNGQ